MLPLERAEPPVMAAFLQRPSLLARWAGDGAGQVAGIKLQTSHERLPLQLRWVNQKQIFVHGFGTTLVASQDSLSTSSLSTASSVGRSIDVFSLLSRDLSSVLQTSMRTDKRKGIHSSALDHVC